MARIAGVDLPNEKRVEVALTYIYGIGRSRARKILESTGVNPNVRVKALTEDDTAKLRLEIETKYRVEGALRRQTTQNIQRLKEIRCYRGIRHMKGLPVRGQNTQSNARTRKGPRKTVAGKKSVKALG